MADRANNRVQSFRLDGTFLKEGFVKRESRGTGTAFGVALSADPEQRFLYVADGSNERIAILDRASLEEIGQLVEASADTVAKRIEHARKELEAALSRGEET